MSERVPENTEAEQQVLGAVLLGGVRALDKAREAGLMASHFYRPAHEALWGAMERLAATGQQIDHTTLCASLTAEEQRLTGAPQSLPDLVTSASVPGFIEVHARAVVDAWALRSLVTAGQRVVQLGLTAPHNRRREALERARAALDEVELPEEKRGAVHVGTALEEVLDRVERGNSDGVPTGFGELDELLAGGPGPGQVMVVGARPSVGKTMMGTNIVRNVVRRGLQVALFSLEMTRGEITQRMLSAQAGVPLKRLRSGDVGEHEWTRIAEATASMSGWPMTISDESTMTVPDMRARLRQITRRSGPVGLIMVDYLQLVTPTDGRIPREQQVAQISRGSKALAKDFACPVLMLAQLSRQTEQRKDAKPLLSDLRESGAIENDADIVVLMHQPQGHVENPMTLIVAKNRQGERGEVEIDWVPRLMRASDGASRADREALWQSRMGA